jgi:hypothetical protein
MARRSELEKGEVLYGLGAVKDVQRGAATRAVGIEPSVARRASPG